MKILNAVLRIAYATILVWFGYQIAPTFTGLEVTAPGLVIIAALILAAAQITRAFIRIFERQPAIDHGSAAHMTAVPALTLHKTLPARSRHEAGHAVVAGALGHRVVVVSVSTCGASGGRTIWRHRDSDLVDASVDHVAVAFAGPLAERTGDVVDSADGSDDYSLLMRTAIAAAVIDPQRRAPTEILDAGVALARGLLAEHAAAVDVIADKLISTDGTTDLDEEQINRLLKSTGVVARPKTSQIGTDRVPGPIVPAHHR